MAVCAARRSKAFSCACSAVLWAAEKERLGENIDVLERRLSVIQKTESYLAEAKDLITSKYLSKKLS